MSINRIYMRVYLDHLIVLAVGRILTPEYALGVRGECYASACDRLDQLEHVHTRVSCLHTAHTGR